MAIKLAMMERISPRVMASVVYRSRAHLGELSTTRCQGLQSPAYIANAQFALDGRALRLQAGDIAIKSADADAYLVGQHLPLTGRR